MLHYQEDTLSAVWMFWKEVLAYKNIQQAGRMCYLSFRFYLFAVLFSSLSISLAHLARGRVPCRQGVPHVAEVHRGGRPGASGVHL